MRSASVALLLVFAAVVGAAPPDVVQLPVLPVPAPMPVPPAPPGAAISLSGEQVYDFFTTAPCDVSVYPDGLVSVASEVVPAGETLRIKDTFFDGAKQRNYKGPCTVYFLKATGTGAPQLTVSPVGFKLPNEIKRVVFNTKTGTAPQPPPKPDPDPKPPVPVVTATGEWVVVIAAEANPSVAQGKILDGPTLRALKTAGKCRIYTDVSEADKIVGKGYDKLVRDAAVKSPVLIVLDGVGKTVLIQAMPLDETTLATTLKGVMK